jgi:phenylalanyl-tRNA synthetase alpha chain
VPGPAAPPPPSDPSSGPPDPLDQAALDAACEAALEAFAAAVSLDALAAARTAHVGDRSPVARARRAIGGLPGPQKSDAGKRVNVAASTVSAAYDARKAALEDERDARCWSRRRSTSPVLPQRGAGARHPLTTISERVADVFVAMGWEVAEGPSSSTSGSTSTPSTSAATTRRARSRTRCSSSRPAAGWCCARTPRRCRCARC